jgi:hypothetical protein
VVLCVIVVDLVVCIVVVILGLLMYCVCIVVVILCVLLYCVCIVVVILCVLLYCVCIALFPCTLDAGLLARSQYWKVLRPAISTQVFLGFPVSISKC